MDEITIGERVAKLRKTRKLSQRGLAIKSDISNATISRIESGESLPDANTTQVLAKALGVSIDFLLTGKNKEEAINDDFHFALYDMSKDLTEGQKRDVLKIVNIIKNQGKE